MNIKEMFQNINKKNVAIIAAVLFAVVICSVCGFEYAQIQKAKSEIAQQDEAGSPDLSGAPTQENAAKQNAEPTKKPSEYKIGIPYEQAMKTKKPTMVLFYADWCHYCIRFMPTYQTLSKIYKDDYNFSKVNVEDMMKHSKELPKTSQPPVGLFAETYEKLVKEIGITGFPTVYLIDSKYDNRVLLSNAIFGDMKQLRGELDRFLRIRKLLDKKH